jgi:hypothetical protein
MPETKKETYDTPQLEQQELLRDITADLDDYAGTCGTSSSGATTNC